MVTFWRETTIEQHPPLLAETTKILGIPIHNLSVDGAINTILQRLARKQQTRVCYVNAHCFNVAMLDAQYKSILASADIVLPDGIGIRMASNILGQSQILTPNVTDLFARLWSRLSNTGKRIYLLGGKPGVADRLVDWIEARYPNSIVCGSHHGYFSPDESHRVVAKIRSARPDVLMVAMGVPRQEKWLATYSEMTGATVTIGVGGLFDFYSGQVSRAPGWMRQIGLEWFYRLLQEPRRLWQRYLIGNFTFLLNVVWQATSGIQI